MSDLINERAPIVPVAPVTTRKTERVYAFEALIEPSDGGLSQRSEALLLHLHGIDKPRIVGHYGQISSETMDRVEAALRIVTGLKEL